MAEKIGEAYVEVRADTDGMESGLRGSLGRISGLVAGAFGGGAVVSFTGSMISAASDLVETTSKVGVLFGDGAGEIQKWASTAATSIGQSSNTAMQAASTFATFGKSAGLAGTDLVGFSTSMTGLASDLASFNNTSPEEAIEAIGAAMRGEAEPIRKYGVLLDDASLRNRALAMGLISTTKEALTPQQKVLAAQAEIMAQTTAAQGDFARTSSGLANQQRILAASFEDAKSKLGEALLPIATKVVAFLAEHMGPTVERLQEVFGRVADKVREVWPEIQTVVEAVFNGVQVAADWLVTNVVPPIVAAMEWAVGWVRDNWPEIQATIANVVDWIGTNVVPVVETVVGFLVAKFDELAAWVRQVWPDIVATVSAAIERIKTVIETVIAVIQFIWKNWGDNILNIATAYFGYIKNTIENAINFVREIISVVMAVIRGDWGAAWDGIKGALAAVWEQIKNVVSLAGGLLKEGLSILWDGIKLAAGAAWDGIKALISAAVDALVGYVKALPGKMLDWVSDLAGAALDLGEAIVKGIGDGLKGVGAAIAEPFKVAWNAVAGWWNSNVGNLSFGIPDWVPGIGGNGFDMPNLPKFHKGGVVPGASTEESLALLRGGEVVFTEDQMRALASYGFGQGRGPAVNVEEAHFHNDLDMDAFGRMAGFVLAGAGAVAA